MEEEVENIKKRIEVLVNSLDESAFITDKHEADLFDLEIDIDSLKGFTPSCDSELSILIKKIKEIRERYDFFNADDELEFMFPNEE